MKICFETELKYQNFVNRIKTTSLGSFLSKGLDKAGVSYYIATNLPDNLSEYKDNDSIKVFDIEDLRKDKPLSIKHELLPEDPTGIYPSKYPWNLRRFIIEKAAMDGFDFIIYVDADNTINLNVNLEDILTSFKSNYEPNTVQTNSAVFKYSNGTPHDVFQYHDEYKKLFDFKFDVDDYDTLDGPVQVFIGETNESILKFTSNWHKFAEFGYEKEFGFGYDNNKHGNLSFVIPLSGFKLKWRSYPFFQDHRPEDRY
jgi:hypothetical protein